ncbi:MAG: sulfatase-like hydrolase/transferase [Bacteroidales bacterium]|nr:sulfatase-like hydrolase/transferase [Bacteroidales bacterium]
MDKSIFLLLSGSLTGLGNTYCNGQNLLPKPNFIIFQVDDLGWTDIGCFGSKFYETPNIDKLAANGMKFTNAYAPCAVSSPSRAAILTGRYPARIGITDWIRASFQIPATLDMSNLPEYETVKGKSLQTPLNPFEMNFRNLPLPRCLNLTDM